MPYEPDYEHNEVFDVLETLRDNVLENANDDTGQNPKADEENFLDVAAICRTMDVLHVYGYSQLPQSRGLSGTTMT